MRLPLRPVSAEESTLAERGQDLANAGEFLDLFKNILNDPYDPKDNSDGFINIGTSENVKLIPPIRKRQRTSTEAHDGHSTSCWRTSRIM